MPGQKAFILVTGLLLAVQVIFSSRVALGEGTTDLKKMDRLERLIEEQQRQLELMRQELDQLKRSAAEAQNRAEEAKATAEEAKTAVTGPAAKKAVASGSERIRLTLYGQVNRAVNIADDGKDTGVYSVDNDSSNSRVGFVGTAEATDDLTIGSRLEVAIAPNESSQVTQGDEQTGDFFDQRWAEVSLSSKRFGKLSLGQGDTASNSTAEVDVSRTNVIQSSSVADIAGGLRFRQENDGMLTEARVSDVFRTTDGLSRKSRIRYDTPVFHGFHFAGSVVSDQRYDASVWWGARGAGLKAAGAFGFANPKEPDTNNLYNGSFSLLHESSGLNATLSAGVRDLENQSDPKTFYVKGGWLASFFSVGRTAFGIDYTKSNHVPTQEDSGWSVGAAVVQHLEKFGTELYLQYRIYSLDRDTLPDVHDIRVGTFGARVKF